MTFGLGAARGAAAVEVAWPSGAVDKVPNVPPGSFITVEEGKGAVATVPLPASR